MTIVFPTRVGMDHTRPENTGRAYSIPHTRGDGPQRRFWYPLLYSYSPHAWGWTAQLCKYTARNNVFPTRVGMDRGKSLVI